MGLTQLNFEGKNKVEVAIMRFQQFEPPAGYYLAFSGGKDSVVIYDLAEKAGGKFDAHYNRTGIDPPELVYFIRDKYPGMIWEKPKENIWKLIERKGMPRRQSRFCCEYLKEHTGDGRVVVTGIRWQESGRRRRRHMVETCIKGRGKSFLHPIIDWTEADIWEYIKVENLPYFSLDDEGFKRLGCVLCPMVRDTKRQIERWPKIAEAWRRACTRYYNKGSEGVKRWPTDGAMWSWWLDRDAPAIKDNEVEPRFI